MEGVTASATVDVLTAEVRVLMVGSRQITRSVVLQLDSVDPDEIEPYGRVRIRDEDYFVRAVDVVGRGVGGALVKSRRSCRVTPMPESFFSTRGPGSHEQYLAERDNEMALIAEWEKLPLIVLAGLR